MDHIRRFVDEVGRARIGLGAASRSQGQDLGDDSKDGRPSSFVMSRSAGPATGRDPLSLGMFARIGPPRFNPVASIAAKDDDSDDDDDDVDDDEKEGPAAAAGVSIAGLDDDDDDDDDEEEEKGFNWDEQDDDDKKNMLFGEVAVPEPEVEVEPDMTAEEKAEAELQARVNEVIKSDLFRDTKLSEDEKKKRLEAEVAFQKKVYKMARDAEERAVDEVMVIREKKKAARMKQIEKKSRFDFIRRPVGNLARKVTRKVLPTTGEMKIPDKNKNLPPYTRSYAADRRVAPPTPHGATWEVTSKKDLRSMPSRQLFAANKKPHWKKEEEDAMELDLMGISNTYRLPAFLGWTPFFKDILEPRNFAVGVYADYKKIDSILGPKWAREDPKRVLGRRQKEFMREVIDNSRQLGVCVMAHAARDQLLGPIRWHYRGDIKRRMAKYGRLTAEDRAAARAFADMFDPRASPSLKGAAFLRERALGVIPIPLQIKKGSKVVVSTVVHPLTTEGGVEVEAISPGINREREGHALGRVYNDKLAKAVADLAVGTHARSKKLRKNTAQAMLYCANGFVPGKNPNETSQESRMLNLLEQTRTAVSLKNFRYGTGISSEEQKSLAIHEQMLQAYQWQEDDRVGRPRGSRGEWLTALLAHVLDTAANDAPRLWRERHGLPADCKLDTQKQHLEVFTKAVMDYYCRQFDQYLAWAGDRGYFMPGAKSPGRDGGGGDGAEEGSRAGVAGQ